MNYLEMLTDFFETNDFFEGVLLQTSATIRKGNAEWWAVDLYDGGYDLVYNPTVGRYRIKGRLIHFIMLSESDLSCIQNQEVSLEVLIEKLKKHPEMLTDIKKCMREQAK